MSPKIPRLNKRGLNYWKKKGKNGKDVMVYLHDDLDGIFSAVVIKERLIELGYNIKGYGVINYQEGWSLTTLDPKMINVAVDFANMPDSKRENLIDVYIDHHGEFTEEEKEHYKDNPVIKTSTASAYEGICRVIGVPLDSILLYSIDMIDSAKYDDYGVRWTDILNFNWSLFKEISNRKGIRTIRPFESSGDVTITWNEVAKLTFAGAFNQYLKRSDHKTLIETVSNLKGVSIYSIYNTMKKIYPYNNVWFSGYSIGQPKDFIEDGKWRIGEMEKRTRGNGKLPKIYNNQRLFIQSTEMNPSGYQIIGRIMYVPSGTWSNALRARAILEQDYNDGIIPRDHQVDFIVLQYGNTIQVCGYKKIQNLKNPPVLSNGESITDLGKYMTNLLTNFKKYFGYYDPDTSIGQTESTVSGGHMGIGTISNINGSIHKSMILDRDGKTNKYIDMYDGYRYLDLIKNKIINDLSGIKWRIGLKWSDGADDSKSQLIRDIINNDIVAQEMITYYIETNLHTRQSKNKLRKKAIDILKSNFTPMEYLRIKEIHKIVMMDYKVMMIDSIRIWDKENNTFTKKQSTLREYNIDQILN